MQFTHALSSLGLSKKESEFYLALLEHGPMTGYELAVHLGLKRNTAYYTLEELRRKGLLLKIPYASKRVYEARDPREVLSDLKRKVSDIESAIPALITLGNLTGQAKIKYYEGLDGFDASLTEMEKYAAGKEMVGFHMYNPTITQEHIDRVKIHLLNLKKLQSRARVITPDYQHTRELAEELAAQQDYHIRCINKDVYPLNISIDTIAHVTRIVSRAHGQCFIIENKDIADGVRAIFELVWNSLDYINSDHYPGKQTKR